MEFKNKIRTLFATSFVITVSACSSNSIVTTPSTAPNTPIDNAIKQDSIKLSEKRELSFKVAVVRGSGDIVPVPMTEFVFRKYNAHSLIESYKIKNNLPAKPNATDSKYSSNCGTYVDNKVVCIIDFSTFLIDLTTWYKDNFSNFKEEQKKASNNTSSMIVKTDLSGDATVNLENGLWYVTGNYNTSSSLISWQSTPIKIDENTKKIELSNDTGKILDTNIRYDGTSYYTKKEYNDSNEKLYENMALMAFEKSIQNE